MVDRFLQTGWLNGGLTASFEKLIIDAELLQMMAAWCEPLTVDASSLALEAVREFVERDLGAFGERLERAKRELATVRRKKGDS